MIKKVEERKIGAQIQHYSSKKGIIKGLKIINRCIIIYLIEFADHNRAWVTEKEIV